MRTHTVCLVAAAMMLLGPAAISAETDANIPSLEELLLQQIVGMELTGIHHTHEEGDWMIGISRMQMSMEGNRDGGGRISDAGVLGLYMVAPTDMDMEMTMLHLMHAPKEDWTVMLMLPYVETSMDHVTRMGTEFTTKTKGLGDIEFGAIYELWEGETRRVDVMATLGVPTGGINEKDQTPMGKVRLPYPMQLGSGTWDVQPGITLSEQVENWNWGGHLSGWLRFGENRNDYRLGNSLQASAWVARAVTESLSASIRLDYNGWGDIRGRDLSLNRNAVPTADPKLRGGDRLDVMLGLNLFTFEGALAGHRLALEAGIPITQDLDGPQLELDSRWSLEWTALY